MRGDKLITYLIHTTGTQTALKRQVPDDLTGRMACQSTTALACMPQLAPLWRTLCAAAVCPVVSVISLSILLASAYFASLHCHVHRRTNSRNRFAICCTYVAYGSRRNAEFVPFAPWPPSGHVSVSEELSALSQASYRQGKSPVPRIKTTLTPDWVR